MWWLENVTILLTLTRSLLITGGLLLGYLWYRRSQQVFLAFEAMGVTGPKPETLAGNASQAFKLGLCQAITMWTNKYGKSFGMYLSKPTLVVSDPDLLREILQRKFDNFRNRTHQPFFDYLFWRDGLLALKDDRWKHVRKALSPIFSTHKLQSVVPTIDTVIEHVLKYIQEQVDTDKKVELNSMALDFSIDVIAKTAFGKDVGSLAKPKEHFRVQALELLEAKRTMIPVVDTPFFKDANPFVSLACNAVMFPSMLPVVSWLGRKLLNAKLTEFYGNIAGIGLRERRQGRQVHNDILQLIVNAEVEHPDNRTPVDAEIDHSRQLTTSADWNRNAPTLRVTEVLGNTLQFLFTAYEPIANAMSYTLFCMAANPEVLAKAQAEVDTKIDKNKVTYDTASQLSYLEMCILEAMRLFPPALFLDRECRQDIAFDTIRVQKDFRVLVPIYCMNRDPEDWPEPETYDPERHKPDARASRHPYLFLPFGAGPRNCIGMKLAMAELRMMIASILQRYSPVLCEESVYPPVLNHPETQLKAKDGLWVKFTGRE